MRIQIKFFLFTVVILFPLSTLAESINIISKPDYEVRMDLNVVIPMRDGVKLSTDFYFPDAKGKFPAILIRTPYHKSTPRYDGYGKFYASRGYVVIIQDCRGRYDSGGEWYPFAGEEFDGYDTMSSAKDIDFCGKLVDVHPNGASYNFCYAASGIISARFRESVEKASLIEPGKIYNYEIKLRPAGIVFKKGHRIRVEIYSSDFPIFNRNLNTGKNPYTSTEMLKANKAIYHDAEHSSHIVLPVIER